MAVIKDLLQSADWKKEKHVPAIESPDTIQKGTVAPITVSVGKEIAHPNTTEHHISWIEVYFLAKGEKFAFQIGKFDFTAHGASTQGPNTSTIYSEPKVVAHIKTDKSGTIMAISYCNIHGLWENAKEIEVV